MVPDPRFLGDAMYSKVNFHISDFVPEFYEHYPICGFKLDIFITSSDDIGEICLSFARNCTVWIDFDPGKGRRAKALVNALCDGFKRPSVIFTDLGQGLEVFDPWKEAENRIIFSLPNGITTGQQQWQ